MGLKNCWTISSSYDFQAHQQRSQQRCCLPQTALLWFEVLTDMLLALPVLSAAPPTAPRLVVVAPRLVSGTPTHSEGQQECPPRVQYTPEIDASKFTLHILSDTPEGFQWLKYILLMQLNEPYVLSRSKKHRGWTCSLLVPYSSFRSGTKGG